MTLPPTLPASLPPLYPPLMTIPAKQVHHRSVWQLVLGILSLVSYLMLALILISMLEGNGSGSGASINVSSLQSFTYAIVFFAMLCSPSIYTALRRLNDNEPHSLAAPKWTLIAGGALLLVWGGLIYLGDRLSIWSHQPALTALMNVLVISLPILIWVVIGSHGLKTKSAQRLWATFNFSQFVTMGASMLVEVIALLVALLAAGSWLVQQPEFLPYVSLLDNPSALTQQQITSIAYDIMPLINTGVLYALVGLAICLFVPLVEELLKPLGMWLFIGKDINPSEGFFLGLVCGSAFALTESLLIMGAAGSDWTSTVIGRAGTSLLHVTTTAITGWAMAKSWRDGKYMRISLAYLGMILLHGTWNFFAMLMGLSDMVFPIDAPWMETLIPVAQWVLCGLAAGMITLLFVVNRRLQKESKPPVLQVTISQL
jgi:hypothetical protein